MFYFIKIKINYLISVGMDVMLLKEIRMEIRLAG